jgi:uncharacterized protein YndB with AHSA1/START domain
MTARSVAARNTANSHTFETTTPGQQDVVVTRVFDAPRELVFEAMSKPEHVKRWWGLLDERYSVPVCEIDFRVGGRWRYVGRGPMGDIEFYGEYREIEAPERVVFTEIFAQFPDVVSVITSVLTVEGRKTRLTASCTYPSREVRDQVVGSGMERGAAISYDRLEELLAELQRV